MSLPSAILDKLNSSSPSCASNFHHFAAPWAPRGSLTEGHVHINPTEVIKTSDLAPPPRAPVGPSDARDGLGLTAVAYSTTLSLSFFSVSPKISTGGLTNMAKSHYPPAFRQTRESRRK